MRPALLNPCFWPEVRRGSERFAHELLVRLVARGHRPRLITSHPGRPARTTEHGFEVVRLWRPPDDRLRRRMFDDHLTHAPLQLLELLRGDDDLAHALYAADGWAAAVWKRRTRKPVVLSYMGTPHRAWLVGKRLRLESTVAAVRGADAVVALSRHAAAGFRRWLGVDALVIEPGVDLEAFRPDVGPRAEHPTIICTADLAEPRKRVGLLVEAFAQVRREQPGARLVLSRPRRDVPLPDAPGIEIRDLDDRAALIRANREAWVAALPSYGEAFGLVLLEGMACGTPVVASNREALPEVVDSDRVGRLFDGDEPADVARALLEALDLARDPATEAACRARAEQFSWNRTADRYEALYRRLLDRRC